MFVDSCSVTNALNRTTINEQLSTKMAKVSEVEIAKDKSRYLRGTIQESLVNDITGSLYHDDTHLIKFHGSYQQTDRDLDAERKRQKLEGLFSFMIRVRVPGGVASPNQWLRMSELADEFGNGTLKLTTRQAFQLHGIYKKDLRGAIQGFNEVLLDSIAGCGDVNRNVMCNTNPHTSPLHGEVYEHAAAISAHLTPRTTAYYEIWLNGEKVNLGTSVLNKNLDAPDEEPIYGKHYLPRKFKIAIAIPPHNETDIYSNDVGLIAIEKDGALEGYNVVAGGGMGMTFGMPDTYPRLADVLGYCTKDKVIDVCEKIMTIQRDWGNRENRKFSRLKYTIDANGLVKFKNELTERLGYSLETARPYVFTTTGDNIGWSRETDGKYDLTVFVEGGRIADKEGYKLKTATQEIAALNIGEFRLTGNQNLMICRLTLGERRIVESILERNGFVDNDPTAMRKNSIACTALNTCTLAFAEAERYLPDLIDQLDTILHKLKLQNDSISIRMTGCPNGCGRPYLGEIGLVGRAVGRYNLYLGASHNGERLNKLYKEMLNESEILSTLEPILKDYADTKLKGEHFGDFVIRKNYVKETTHGKNFHAVN